MIEVYEASVVSWLCLYNLFCVTRERTQGPLRIHRAKYPDGRGPKDLNSGRGPEYLKFLFFLASLIDWHVRALSASHMLHCSAVLAVKVSSFLFFCVKGEDPRTSNIFKPILGKEGRL